MKKQTYGIKKEAGNIQWHMGYKRKKSNKHIYPESFYRIRKTTHPSVFYLEKKLKA